MRTFVAAALAAVLGLAAPAADAKPGKHALVKVEQLQKGQGVKTGHELTPALNQLYASLPSLSGADRRRAESFLARPDDTQRDPSDTHKWTPPEAGNSPVCLTHFCVHWVAATADAPSLADTDPADGIPDYPAQMAAILENEVYPCENGTGATACGGFPGQGWREAASDFGLGGDNRTDVYIQDLYSNEGVFGYVAIDPDQAPSPSVPHFAYMVLDKDYSRYANGDAAGGHAAEQVTAAHEYNHILQNAYDYLEDGWMFEGTAVYMEEKVFPQVNDYLHYVPAFASNTKQPLTQFTRGDLKPYGSAVWEHWLDHRFGPPVIRSAWELSVGNADFAPGAFGAAIQGAGGAGFSDEFERFSAAAAEWNVPGAGFPDAYPDVARDGTLPAGSQTSPFALPHTTFALFDVPIPQAAPVIRLTATLPAGTLGAVALVGRTGSDRGAGTLTSNLSPLSTAGTWAVELDNPGSFGRITAVVVNSDPTHAGFDLSIDDYVFTKDAQNVVASVIEPGPPIPVTGAPGLLSDHGAFVNATVDPHLLDTTWSIEFGLTSSYASTSAPQSVPAATVGAAPVATLLPGLRANSVYHYRVLATNSAGAAAGQDQTFRTARDVTRPKLIVTAKPQKIRTARTRGVLYLARCSERCLGSAEVRLGRSTARRLGLPGVLGRSRVTLDPKSSSSRLRVRLSPRAKRLLAGLRRGFTATLKVSVRDQALNLTAANRRVRLARSR